MTCREKLKIEYPERVNKRFVGGCLYCPHDYGYLPKPDWCLNEGTISCIKCWRREIADEYKFDHNTDDLHNDIDELRDDLMFSGFTEEQTRIILEGFHIIVNYLKRSEKEKEN